MDYTAAFGNEDGLLRNWDKISKKILTFLEDENHVKDKTIKSFLQHLKTSDSINESKYIHQLLRI